MLFDIAAQPLARALNQYSEATGFQLVYEANLADNKISSTVVGSFNPVRALAQLLAGTGLQFRFTDPRTAIILAGNEQNGARTLGPVRVEGVNSAVAGINGSSDPTATEATGSYTSSALAIASKTPQSIKDTPQSVSVITQQRMQDQNLTDFSSALAQATGVTAATGYSGAASNLDSTFFSRGFIIDSIQIDGGAPLNTSFRFYPLMDMAQYDHVELLRGAAGVLNGYGDPSGSVNLVRKRPLDHAQVIVEGQVGSWNNYRTVLDLTAPFTSDGRLRGRLVTVWDDSEYFYETASSDKTSVYGIVEADVTQNTLVSVGSSFTRQNAVPWVNGLPRYENGDDLKLPRSTCLCLPWSRSDFDTTEVFAQLAQDFGENWSIKLNVTRIEQEGRQKVGVASGTLNPVTDTGMFLAGTQSDYANTQTTADSTLTGTFELFGQRQELAIGANWQDVDGGPYRAYGNLYSDPRLAVDPFGFDPDQAAYAEPAAGEPFRQLPKNGQEQWGGYATLRLTPWQPLHLISGVRYSRYRYEQTSELLCNNQFISFGLCDTPGEVWSAEQSLYRDEDFTWPPAVSLVYDITKNFSVYAGYTDVYKSQATTVDRDLKPIEPITGSNIEAGLKWTSADERLNASLAGYRIEQKGYATRIGLVDNHGNDYTATFGRLPDGQRSCCYSNDADKVNLSQGVDVEVTGEVLTGLQLVVGYTWNENKYEGADYDSSENKPLISLQPRHLLKLWASYQLQSAGWQRGLNIGGGMNWQSKAYQAGNACVEYGLGADPTTGLPTAVCESFASYEYTQKAYEVLSARVAYQLVDSWNIALNLNNITDTRYYQTMGTSEYGNWYGEPRNFMLTLRGQF